MNDDEMVTLEVTGDRAWVRYKARNESGPLGIAARRWVEAHDRPERRVWRLLALGDNPWMDSGHAVAVEDLRPGDRVAGREVENARPYGGGCIIVDWAGESGCASYAPGTLIVLDGDQ